MMLYDCCLGENEVTNPVLRCFINILWFYLLGHRILNWVILELPRKILAGKNGMVKIYVFVQSILERGFKDTAT